MVHRLILEAFVGPCPEGMETCHFPDINPTNNALENLRWDTRSENTRDQIASGTFKGYNNLDQAIGKTRAGENNGRAKLTAEQVREIIAARKSGVPTKELAAQYAMSIVTIRCIVRGARWKSLQS
jgi:hypothetical protein